MNVAFFTEDVKGCFTSDQRQMPCCEDTHEIIEIDKEHKSYVYSNDFTNEFITIVAPLLLNLEILEDQTSKKQPYQLTDPPDISSEPIYLLHSSLTYYG